MKRVTCVLRFLGFFALLDPTASAQRVTYEREPIHYADAEVNDRVAVLADQVLSGEVTLEFDERFGYLKSVLDALEVSIASQTLVFSKTSLQLHRISPRRPRALYFNDDVYVGYCQHGDVLEFAATDPKQGATFYTLSQDESEQPLFVRDKGGCLSCHASNRTQGVPGYLVRSVFADAAGRPKLGSGTFLTDHTSEFRNRWGGWYVSGSHGTMRHMGNSISTEEEHLFDRDSGANDLDLRDNFRTENYLTAHSDLVALMVLEHQTQMHNAIAAANYETRLALHQSYQMNELLDRPQGHVSDIAKRRISSSADRVLRYLLFCDEFQLSDRVSGTTDFALEFSARGIRDAQGRSLRDFELESRMFRYPCSYLIHSEAFAALPDAVRRLVLTRLRAILDGNDDSGDFAHLVPKTRHAIREILEDTLPEFKPVTLARRD
ncbi:MAG: hypothetical protein AAGD07_18885 [Planctomycetota bacterium]